MDLSSLSGLQISQKIKKLELDPSEVLSFFIEETKKWNPHLNAMVEDNFDAAEKQAKNLAIDLKRNPQIYENKKFVGVPFTVKEMLAVNGFRRTAGNIYHKDDRSDFNSPHVQRILDEGALLLGTSNVPEMGFWFETNNPIYGRTNNPYDLHHTPGGSSGGEGALIGSGASVFGVGSDVGGSIRMPANFCGIFGHKPSRMTVPFTGHFPTTIESVRKLTEKNYSYTCVGPMSRFAEDMEELAKIFNQPDGNDPLATEKFIPLSLDSLNQLKVYFCCDPQISGTSQVSGEIQSLIFSTARFFEKSGAQIFDFPKDFFLPATRLWGAGLRGKKEKSFEENLSPQKINLPKEFIRLWMGKGRHTFPSLGTVAIERFLTKENPQIQAENLNKLENLKHKLFDLLDPRTILIFPVFPTTAPEHQSPLFSPFNYIYSGFFNVLGVPATAVPFGLGAHNLPLGLQIISSKNNDLLNLFLAKELEKSFGGWQKPK